MNMKPQQIIYVDSKSRFGVF